MSILQLKQENAELKREITYLKKKIRSLMNVEFSSEHEKIKDIINCYFDVNMDEPSRTERNVKARTMYWNYIRKHSEMSLMDISGTMGKIYNHTTILHGLKNHDDYMQFNKVYQRQYNEIESLIKSNLENYEQRLENKN